MFVLEIHLTDGKRATWYEDNGSAYATARTRGHVYASPVEAVIEANGCPEGWWVMEREAESGSVVQQQLHDGTGELFYCHDSTCCPKVFRDVAAIVYGTPLPSGNARAEVPSGVPSCTAHLWRELVAMRNNLLNKVNRDTAIVVHEALHLMYDVFDAGLAALDEDGQG